MKIHIIYLGIFNIKLLTLYNCQNDITSHSRYWKGGGDRICAKEADLLLCRSGLFDVEKSCRRLLLICWGHRDSLGIYWKPRAKNKCKYSLRNNRSCKAVQCFQGDMLSFSSHSSCWKW